MNDLIIRNATLEPTTFNADNRTVSVVFASNAPVRRLDLDGAYEERLDMNQAAVDLSELIGGPVLVAWRMGIFDQPKDHILLLILGGVGLMCLMISLFVAGAIISVLAKDFAIPIMALENVGILDAWRRMRPMLSGEKLSFAGYIGMKIALALGTGILFGIITLIAMLLLMIPMGIAGVGIYLMGTALGLEWNLLTITITVLLGAVAVHIFLAAMAFISVPPLVFFQSYVLHFFGSRYPRLGEIVFPPPPPSPPPPKISPITPGPEPAPAV